MPSIYQFLGTHEVLIYILLSIGAMFGLRWLWRSWNEWRHAVYSLEREFALRRIGQSMASLGLILVLFLMEFIVASFVFPSLPASMFVPTATPDLYATPTGTISPELATAIALTPRPNADGWRGRGLRCRSGLHQLAEVGPGGAGHDRNPRHREHSRTSASTSTRSPRRAPIHGRRSRPAATR